MLHAVEPPKQALIVVGPSNHPPNTHEPARGAKLMKHCLETLDGGPRLQADIVDRWPDDAESLRQYSTVVLIGDQFPGERLEHSDRVMKDLARMMARGCGIVCIHYATGLGKNDVGPDGDHPLLHWTGGYFATRCDHHQSVARIYRAAKIEPANPEHPIARGWSAFEVHDEPYIKNYFGPHEDRMVDGAFAVATSQLPPGKPQREVVAWGIEREDGGRGFGVTLPHFYRSWKLEPLRKFILNGIVWTAHLEVPENGVKSSLAGLESAPSGETEPPRKQPKKKESQDQATSPDPAAAEPGDEKIFRLKEIDSADDEPRYADKPYWYKPGHPLRPARKSDIQTLPGFEVDEIFSVPEEFGSWVSLAVDEKGRLLASAQHRDGIYRITPPALDDSRGEVRVEKLGGAAARIGRSQGLLVAFDSLWVVVSDNGGKFPTGLYRLRDTDGDDQYDTVETIRKLRGNGEHGPHNLVLGPDGNSIYMMGGNGTRLPAEGVKRWRPSRTTGVDHLLPPGYRNSKYRVGGWVCRMDRDGENWELELSGLRNSYDLAFNRAGDLFTFDSDMEWDLGTPWYRPTRICHLVSGGEFGWRDDAAKWPEHYEDSVAPVVNIGPASPTGVTFGYETEFPEKYRQALFACDWTFATIHAVHLHPEGASYRAEVEEFISGPGLPVTDIVASPDGALYFAVGGRRLISSLYRVRWVGDDPDPDPRDAKSNTAKASDLPPLHRLRRELERFHGRVSPDAIEAAWPHLGHPDRAIRFAARVAIESQPVDRWRERALTEPAGLRRLLAGLALARQQRVEKLDRVLSGLESLSWSELSDAHRLIALRSLELVLARGEEKLRAPSPALASTLLTLFPTKDSRVDREIARMLGRLGTPAAIEPLLEAMARDGGSRPELGDGTFVRNPKYGRAIRDMYESAPRIDRLHHAQMLLWIEDGWTPEHWRRYFELVADAVENSRGGHSYSRIWDQLREHALEKVPESQREELTEIRAPSAIALRNEDLPTPEGPGQEWTVETVLEAASGGLKGRDFARGQKMFAAAGCGLCHRVAGQGGEQGPDLTTLGRRFQLRDIVDSIIHPSRTISDQYQMARIVTTDGQLLTGRIIARDEQSVRIVTDLLNPRQSTEIPLEKIIDSRSVPVSTMPSKLLDRLNREEVLDLLAFLVSEGDSKHPNYQVSRPGGDDR